MITLNLEFQEEYKRLDRLCKDCLSSGEGVSEYIRQMDSTPLHNHRFIDNWDRDYKKLKHVRWIRNQLAHEVGTLRSDICTKDDLGWVQSFYDKILNGSDPLTVVRKAKMKKVSCIKQQPLARKTESATKVQPKQCKQSFFGKLFSNIKKFFS